MAHVITDECINCGSCEDVCPMDAISEGEDKRVINAVKCSDCGECAENCRMEAIIPGDGKNR